MNEFLIIVSCLYVGLIVLTMVLCFFDWLFGFDTLGKAVEEYVKNFVPDIEVLIPVAPTTAASLIIGIMYLITSVELFKYMFILFAGLSLCFVILAKASYVLYDVLLAVRKYFLNRKKL